MKSFQGVMDKMENNDKDVQKKPKLQITETKNGLDLEYDGVIKLLTKDEYSRMIRRINQLKKQVEKLNGEVSKRGEMIEALKSDLQAEKEKSKGYKSKWDKFASQQGRGRTTILSPEIKQAIQMMYNDHMQNRNGQVSIKHIHAGLVGGGIDISYETVRKYIADSKGKNQWQ